LARAGRTTADSTRGNEIDNLKSGGKSGRAAQKVRSATQRGYPKQTRQMTGADPKANLNFFFGK
jgi:hypothetical protein